jgi:hypothetical protein
MNAKDLALRIFGWTGLTLGLTMLAGIFVGIATQADEPWARGDEMMDETREKALDGVIESFEAIGRLASMGGAEVCHERAEAVKWLRASHAKLLEACKAVELSIRISGRCCFCLASPFVEPKEEHKKGCPVFLCITAITKAEPETED